MATTQAETLISLPRGASLVGDYGEVVALNSSGQAVVATAVTDHPIGVVAEGSDTTPSGVGRAVPAVGSAVAIAQLQSGGILKVKAGAAITVGQYLVLHATDGTVAGVAAPANVADGQFCLGRALEAASAGQIFRFLATPFYREIT